MKKTLISLGVVIAMLSSLICPAVLANDVFTLGISIGTESGVYGDVVGTYDYGRSIAESDKYLFLVVGSSAPGFMMNSKIHVYEKPTAENMGYKYLTSIIQDSTNNSFDLPVRDLWVDGNKLYVNWNNAKTMKTGYADALRGKWGSRTSPVIFYDISDIDEGETLTPTALFARSVFSNAVNPYNRGGASFLDKENRHYYIASYAGTSLAGASMSYFFFNLGGSTPTTSTKTLTGGSLDTVQFIVKDGYLFEVLQNNGGIGVEGRVSQAFNNVRIYDISELANNDNIQTKFLGSYTTAVSGDWVINDIEVSGNTAYVATTEGLEVVDITSAKGTTSASPVTISRTDLLHSETAVNSVVIEDDVLYVGLSDGMAIYDVSTDEPVEIGTYTSADGFQDFAVNTEDNTLYALSAARSGKVLISNFDLLFNKLEVTDPVYTVDNGELNAEMTITNPGQSTVEFNSYYMLYEENRLAQVSVQPWSLAPGESVDFADAVEIDDEDNSYAKIILTTTGASPKVLPMDNGTSIVFEQEYGTRPSVTASSDDAINVSAMDSYGNIAVSGKLDTLKGYPVLAMVENTTAGASDRLEKVRYMDVVTVGQDGRYAFSFMPSDSGTYSIEVINFLGAGSVSDEVVVDGIDITVSSLEEIPSVESELYITLTNGQNIETIDFELTFNSDLITLSEEFAVCDGFTASDIVIDGNTLTAVFTKQAPVTKDAVELCTIPITVKSDAALGDYTISADVTVKDKYETVLDVTTNDGTLRIRETTLKYVAKDAAVAAMRALKAADQITIEDYLTELPKVTEARAKVEEAYGYYLRDSQLGLDLLSNLNACEEKLEQFTPYYEAVDVVEAAAAADMETTLNTNKAFFNITDEALTLYAGATNKALIDAEMEAEDFNTPGDVYNLFHKSLVLNIFSETRWQYVETLLGYAENATELNVDAYNDLETAERKAYVQQALQLRDYADVATLQSALDVAVADAIINVPLIEEGGGTNDGPSGDTDGYSPGSTRVPSSSVFDQDTGVEVTPPAPITRPDVFSDLGQCVWAKDAIEYLNGKGVINGIGDGKFAPMDNVTREAFFKMIALGFGISGTESDITFTDVEDNKWYSEYVYALAGAGIINGRDDGRMGVGEYITREEIAVILDRVSQLKGIDIKPNKEAAIPDEANIGEYAVSAVNKMWASGIINGFEDGTVRPKETASRAQVAQLIYKVMLIQYAI